jgi:23S rRNA (cytidine1920-2'-O)/16S rRNA (cytidine1409-2'-O)-methyltransferase
VLPSVLLLAQEGWLVALVKPQFEVGRANIGKGGIVKDKAAAAEAVEKVAACVNSAGWTVCGQLASPLLGRDGNEETLLGAIRKP